MIAHFIEQGQTPLIKIWDELIEAICNGYPVQLSETMEGVSYE